MEVQWQSEKQTRKPKVNYRELLQVKLPRAKRLKRNRTDHKFYPVKVLEHDEARNRVKIHYVDMMLVMMSGEKLPILLQSTILMTAVPERRKSVVQIPF